MWRPELRAGLGSSSGSLGCPELLQHAQALLSQSSPLYFSFFEEECRAIVDRLRLGAEAEPPRGSWENSALWPKPGWPATSTPVPASTGGEALDSVAGGCEAAAAPVQARRESRCLPHPAAGGGRGARPVVSAVREQRGAGRPSAGRLGIAARSPGRGRATVTLTRTRAFAGLPLPSAGTGRGACERRLVQPAGTRLKVMPPARSRLQHPSGALQKAQHSTLPKIAPRDRETKTAVKVGGHKRPSSGLSTAIPTVASRSSLQPSRKVTSSKRFCLSKGSTTQELVCNRIQKLKENGESKERLVAVGPVLGAGKADHTGDYVESSLSSKLDPGLPSGCKDAVPAEQSAGHQLFQELQCLRKEMKQEMNELAEKFAQKYEAYHQKISLLQAQLRAGGVCLKDVKEH